jgi:hypothetical protein
VKFLANPGPFAADAVNQLADNMPDLVPQPASEVRSLVGRPATAAKEIKDLNQDSVKKVEDGSVRVAQSGFDALLARRGGMKAPCTRLLYSPNRF